ncbi:MAG: BMP family ABC transporter substrate-binding protein [Peptococcaceae bacterium]|nr:BMP family ABC transporter substrate-binding protein [Peptococcaceae bacterium]
MKRIFTVLLIILLSLTLVVGCAQKAPTPAPTEQPKEKFKVGFIYVGPIGDAGWTYAHEQGRKMLEKELGVEAIYKESVPESQECEKVIKDMIDQGAKVIFATSYGFQDYVAKVAKEYPNVKFLHCSGSILGANYANYFGSIEEPRYLSGIVAGLKTKKNSIGYVAAYDLTEVIRGINAFTLGVRSVNPKAVVKVKWTNTWFDPAKEKAAAVALLDEGVDVIAQHQDTSGPQVAAEERGVWSVGYNTDMSKMAPKAYMTAPLWNWGMYYVKTVKEIQAGTWKPEAYWGTMKDGFVDLAPLTAVAPPEAKAAVDKVKADMMAGKFNVFAGPIKDQSGKVVVPAGSSVSLPDQLSMKWFVQGVEGKIGK